MFQAMRKDIRNIFDAARKRRTHPIPALTTLQYLPPEQVEKIAKHKVSPWVENNRATFIYFAQHETDQVELIGEVSGWHSQGLALQGQGKLFHLTLELPTDSRLEYKLVVNGDWILDPLNSRKVDNGIGGLNSAFCMGDYAVDPYVAWRPDILHGDVVTVPIKGKAIPGPRNLHLYLPHGYSRSQSRYPVLYVQDGGDYIHRAKLHWVLDNLLADHLIEPLIAVCIDPIERFREYTCNPDYADLLLQEIVPLIDQSYRTQTEPGSRTLLGASLGGLISTFVSYQHPDVFGQVFGQSSSYQFFGEQMVEIFEHDPKQPLRLFLTAGRFEGLIGANRRMRSALQARGYRFEYSEMNEGHTWHNWSHHLAPGLLYFYGHH